MRRLLRFTLALAVALVLMLCFRALAFTVCTIDGEGLEPLFRQGDRVLVNRWSYGLRVGGKGSLFRYDRLGRRALQRGDIVVFEHPQDDSQLLVCRCEAVPGDSVQHEGHSMAVPGRYSCEEADYYWLRALSDDNPTDSRELGFISEEHIIGRVTMILYSHRPSAPFWRGWRRDRTLLPL